MWFLLLFSVASAIHLKTGTYHHERGGDDPIEAMATNPKLSHCYWQWLYRDQVARTEAHLKTEHAKLVSAKEKEDAAKALPKLMKDHEGLLLLKNNLFDMFGDDFLKEKDCGSEPPEGLDDYLKPEKVEVGGKTITRTWQEDLSPPEKEAWAVFLDGPDMKTKGTEDKGTEDAPEPEDPALLELPYEQARVWSRKTIPYCLTNCGVSCKRQIWGMMAIMVKHTTIRFASVDCDANGHKLEIKDHPASNHRPAAWVGMRDEVDADKPVPIGAGVSTHQILELNTGHLHYGGVATALHEFLHTLGFYHMQQRSDWATCYKAAGYDEITEPHNCRHEAKPIHGTYDFASIMHYPDDTNGHNCGRIVPVDDVDEAICGDPANLGHARGLAPGDIAAINALYQ